MNSLLDLRGYLVPKYLYVCTAYQLLPEQNDPMVYRGRRGRRLWVKWSSGAWWKSYTPEKRGGT